MHIKFSCDPRIPKPGFWATTGVPSSVKDGDIETCDNFLKTVSVNYKDNTYNGGNIYFCERGGIAVSFIKAEIMLNFFDTMGWTYEWGNVQ